MRVLVLESQKVGSDAYAALIYAHLENFTLIFFRHLLP